MLVKFKDQLSAESGNGAVNKPPFTIKASHLDKNFQLCYPQPTAGNNTPYTIDRSSEGGWKLRGTRVFDVCENGQPTKYRVFAEKMAT
jgi:hypothetical protein